MASRFIVVVVLFAVCHSSPVVRQVRSHTTGVGFSSGYGGINKASVSLEPNRAQAYSSNDNGLNIARDAAGYGLPGQAFAKISTDDDTLSIGKAQPAYYSVPAPATISTYQQYANVPETPSQIVYEQGPGLAQSSATSNGGLADSNANVGFDTAVSNARTQGFGSASSIAQNNRLVAPVATEYEPSITVAKAQELNAAYSPVYSGYGAASSNVNAQFGSATSSAKTGALPARKSISWRFGTAYDNPATYVRAVPAYFGYNSANANANVNNGQGNAKSAAQINAAGSGSANSAANVNGGYANANADVNNIGYPVLRAEENYGAGVVNTAANSYDQGTANADANIDAFGIKSAANSNGNGSAKSSANTGPSYGFRSTGLGSSNTATNAQSNGSGNANSSAKVQGLSTGYRVLNTNANTQGFGSANSNAFIG